MKAFFIHFTIEVKTSLRRKQQMFLIYIFPIGFYLMMGAVMPQLNPMFLDDLIPSMIIFGAMTATFLSIPDQIVSNRESGIYRGYRINGLGKASMILIPALSAIIQTTVTAAVIILTAPTLFGAPVPNNIISIFPLCWLTAFSFSGISVLIGTVSRSSRSSMMLSQIFFIPSMLIGGLMIPPDVLPDNLRRVAAFLPSSHGMTLFRSIAYGREIVFSQAGAFLFIILSGLLCLILAARLFKWNPA